VHHIDLNFGCPVRKVTAKGGGSALPLRPKLFRRLVAAAAAAAGPEVPVTVKLRMGLHPELITFLQVRRELWKQHSICMYPPVCRSAPCVESDGIHTG
jgi:tRNA-dihydrouridine synthase